DFCSAPASSVNGERAFSSARLQVNHTQHNIAPHTFRAKMAVGSWRKEGLLDDLDDVASML
ncbi:hypothetical protein PUNSTDRAFT_40680, partial [Punctularia strigosozonata HHB-11173 SS5]|uniref:uncharacterized protein n=1 Tax=Punctularia strigosozonata (strain HHB-11173) TaxID=741275 RepID=UPI0004417D06